MVSKPRVLIACEFSGIVREEFRKAGCDAWSCDLLPSEIEGQHIQDDVLKHLNDGWDLMIAHPPCTYLCVSGAAHFNKPGRKEKQIEALEFVKALLAAPIEHIALENPVGVISTAIRKPDQYIQPYEHGHEHMKKTGLWLKNLPCLAPSKMVGKGEIWVQKNGRTRGSRWHMCLSPSPDRWKIRSRTFPGIAKAFAGQWAPLLFEKAPTAKEIYKTTSEDRRHVARLRKFGASNYEIARALGIPEDAPVLQE